MSLRARSLTQGKPICIRKDDTLSHAFELMQRHGIRHLPVLDAENGQAPVGILSDRDLQRAMKSELRWDPVLRENAPPFEKVEFDPEARVHHFMSWPVQTVDARAQLRLVAELMASQKISSIVVMRGSRMAGIVTSEDLIRLLVELLDDRQLTVDYSIDAFLSGESWDERWEEANR